MLSIHTKNTQKIINNHLSLLSGSLSICYFSLVCLFICLFGGDVILWGGGA